MTPLAERLRPEKIKDFVGQEHLLKASHPLGQAIASNNLHSMILYGPSGVGKTTLAQIIAKQVNGYFTQMSAVLDGVKELRLVVENAKKFQNIGQKTICFIDEIHRFNKAQQDALLPHVESGLIILIGATTENPSFELNSALLSRLSIYILEPLDEDALGVLIKRACNNVGVKLNQEAIKSIVTASSGDARRAINIVEKLADANIDLDSSDALGEFLQDNVANFDKGGDIFYQQLSAFHKSVRGSSPDGALYWMARMLDGACDPKTIARRLLAIASEDIGNADPRALEITLNAWDIYHRVGDKEGNRAIAQAATYCAVAPKSNAVYSAFKQATADAKKTNNLAVPKHLCNAPTKFDKDKGLGDGYRYAHDEEDGISYGQEYFPDSIGEKIYYQPTDRGLEIKIREKLDRIRGKK